MPTPTIPELVQVLESILDAPTPSGMTYRTASQYGSRIIVARRIIAGEVLLIDQTITLKDDDPRDPRSVNHDAAKEQNRR